MTPNSQKVYDISKSCLGTSLVPIGDDPEVGCAISMTVILREKCGFNIAETLSTADFLNELIASQLFDEVTVPLPGDVIISATGTSAIPNTPISHGHCGTIGEFGILSNNSLTGLFSEIYTLDTWKQRYAVQGGYPMRFFRAK